MQKTKTNFIKTKMLQTAVDLLSNDYAIAIKKWNSMEHDGVVLTDEQIEKFRETLDHMLMVKVQSMDKEVTKALKRGEAKPERILNLLFLDNTVSNHYISESCKAGRFSQTKVPPCSYGMIYMNEKHMLVKTDFEEFGVSNTYIFHKSGSAYDLLSKTGWKSYEDASQTLAVPTR